MRSSYPLWTGLDQAPPIVKSDVDGASAQGAEPGSWKDNAAVQGVAGFLVGFGFGVLPGGGVVEATATAVGVMDEGTPEARFGKALGEMVGGVVLTGVGIGGEAASWALSATGLGAVIGVPAAVVSAEAVAAGAVNVSVGVANLTQAMSTGSGGTTAARGEAKPLPRLQELCNGRSRRRSGRSRRIRISGDGFIENTRQIKSPPKGGAPILISRLNRCGMRFKSGWSQGSRG